MLNMIVTNFFHFLTSDIWLFFIAKEINQMRCAIAYGKTGHQLMAGLGDVALLEKVYS